MSRMVRFPTETKQCEDAIKTLINAGERARAHKEINWWIAHHYLHGARDFRNFNVGEGSLDVNYMTQEGILEFRYEDLTSKYKAQMGRLGQMDMAPRVRRKTIGLEDLKNATVAQIALMHALPRKHIRAVQLQAGQVLLKYGCGGLAAIVDGRAVAIEVVPPWELVPVPPGPLDDNELQGIARVRWVPKEWAKELPQAKGNRNMRWDTMKSTKVPAGSVMSEQAGRMHNSAVGTTPMAGGEGGSMNYPELSGGKRPRGSEASKDERTVELVRYVELWLWDASKRYIAEYFVTVGDQLLVRLPGSQFSMGKQPVPIRHFVDCPTGGFYAKGFVAMNMPLNTEVEFSLAQLFQNVQDFDNFGILTIPTTLGIPPEVVTSRDGVKRIVYQPDYTLPDLRPDVIKPANAGRLPSDVVKLGAELANRVANQPTELMAGGAPGRIDSAGALGILNETANIPLQPTAQSLAAAFAGIYEAILGLLPTVWGEGESVGVALLDDAMAGVMVDPNTGTIQLNAGLNALPHPDSVDIGVESEEPRSKEQQKAEILLMRDKAIIDDIDFRIMCRKQHIDLPVGNEAEYQNYRRAIQNNVILFGDGQTRGPEIAVNDYDDHEVHIRVIRGFMARPEFYSASDAVQQAFTNLLEAHQARLGNYLEQLPYPEDAVLEQSPGAAGPAPGAQPPDEFGGVAE